MPLPVEIPADANVAPRTQVERRQAAEAKLLATAREIVSRKGWAGTTLAEVGEAAGYSRGLAGHYFGNKAGLLRALTEQINNGLMGEMSRSNPPKPGLEAITSFVGIYLGRKDPRWTNTRVLLLLLTEALLDGSENAAEMIRFNASAFAYLERHIRVGIEQGEIRTGISPGIGAEFVVGLLRGVMMQRLVRSSELATAALAEQLIGLVHGAFARPADGAVRPSKGKKG